MKPVLAQSISLYLHRSLPPKCTLRVLSVHRRVLNLETETGQMLAFTHPQIGHGPFHIQLARSVDFSILRPGITGLKDGALLLIGPLLVDGEQPRIWDATLPPMPSTVPIRSWLQAKKTAAQYLQSHPVMDDLDAPTWVRLQAGMNALSKSLQTNDNQLLAASVDLLAGLGPGLTPAGDDVLLGAIARLFLLGPKQLSPTGETNARVWSETIFALAASKTNRFSRAWLWHAAHGRFSQPWHALQQAFITEDEARARHAIQWIADIGATSGRLALMGLFSMH